MRATGVVRRIDDLGRIVIPKEIRKTLRIKEGTPLEIFTEKNGDVILKKYSPIGELTNFSDQYVGCLFGVTGLISIVTDKDSVIAVAGTTKKNLLEMPISEELEKIIDKREAVIAPPAKPVAIVKEGTINLSGKIIVPIISDSEVIGSVILVEKDSGKKISTPHVEIAKVAASFLGSQLEI